MKKIFITIVMFALILVGCSFVSANVKEVKLNKNTYVVEMPNKFNHSLNADLSELTMYNEGDTTAVIVTVYSKNEVADLQSHVAAMSDHHFEKTTINKHEVYYATSESKESGVKYNLILFLYDLNDERVVVSGASSVETPENLKSMSEKVIKSFKRK